MSGTITTKKVVTHPYLSMICALCLFFILPRYGSHDRLRQHFIGLRRGIAGAFPRSERFHDGSNLFGRSHVDGRGGHHRTGTDGRDSRLSNAPNQAVNRNGYISVNSTLRLLEEFSVIPASS